MTTCPIQAVALFDKAKDVRLGRDLVDNSAQYLTLDGLQVCFRSLKKTYPLGLLFLQDIVIVINRRIAMFFMAPLFIRKILKPCLR